MSKLCGFLLAVSAVLLFPAAARAEGGVLLALNKPAAAVNPDTRARTALPAELKAPATAQVRADVTGYTDFDAYSSVNDPLYREGTKELLLQAVKNDAEKKSVPAGDLRDAPVSKGAKPAAARPVKVRGPLKKNKSAKPLHTDPVAVKNTF